jgi:hypothetical protein
MENPDAGYDFPRTATFLQNKPFILLNSQLLNYDTV